MQKLPLCRALARRYLLVWDLRLSKGRGLRSGRHQNTTNKDTETGISLMIASIVLTAPAMLLLKSHDQMTLPIERRDNPSVDAARPRRPDISQRHWRLQSLKGKCPQADWSLPPAHKETNRHLNTLKSNLTSHFQHKNIKRTNGVYHESCRASH